MLDHPPSVGVQSEREESFRHWFQVPNPFAFGPESLCPFFFELIGDGPTKRVVSEPHANEVPLGHWFVAVNKGITAVEDGEVVDIVHVTRLCLDFHLRCPSNNLDGIERF